MDTELKGKLEYISFFQPIRLFTETGEVDLRDHYFKTFSQLNGVKTRMEYTKNSFELISDESSERVIKYENYF